MDKVLRPNVLDIEVNGVLDGKNTAQFQHWEKTMSNFLKVIKDTASTNELKYQVLITYLAKLGNIVMVVMGGKFWKLGGFSEIKKIN